MASPDDVKALNRKIDAMWALGVRAFQLQFQDVSYSEWHCDKDADTYGSGPRGGGPGAGAMWPTRWRSTSRSATRAGEPLAACRRSTTRTARPPTARALAGRSTPASRWRGRASASCRAPSRARAGRRAEGVRSTRWSPWTTTRSTTSTRTGSSSAPTPAASPPSRRLGGTARQRDGAAAASRIPLFTAADYAWNPRGLPAAGVLAGRHRRSRGARPEARAALARAGGQRVLLCSTRRSPAI